MELPRSQRTDPLACQTRKLLVRQGTHRYGFVQCAVAPPKLRIQGQFHYRFRSGVAADRSHRIHQRVGSFTVVKVLVHFVSELRQLVVFHNLQLYAVLLPTQILSKVQ